MGFPLGQNTVAAKVFETEDAIKNGAHEIDYVVNLTQLKEKNYAYVEEEMSAIVELCQRWDCGGIKKGRYGMRAQEGSLQNSRSIRPPISKCRFRPGL